MQRFFSGGSIQKLKIRMMWLESVEQQVGDGAGAAAGPGAPGERGEPKSACGGI